MNKPICAVASGSGGHIIPCITLSTNRLQRNQPLLFIGNNHALDTSISTQFPAITNTEYLSLPKVPYKQWWKLPLFGVQLVTTFFKAVALLKKYTPTVVISTGGYLSLPVCLAAFVLRIPIDLFELNAHPGRTIQFLAPLASNLFICFKQTATYFKRTTVLTNYPLRFTQQDKKLIAANKPTVLILGGSQGSAFLNSMLEKVPVTVLQQWRIIHQTGVADQEKVGNFYTQHSIEHVVFAYHHHLADYYNQATLVICRAGAGTIFETLFFEKPCIIIPLVTATTHHQLDNAYAAQRDHPELVTVLLQQEIATTPDTLLKVLAKKLLD